MLSKNPLWIVVDGMDGAGKSSIVQRITEYLNERGIAAKNVSALGHGKIGKVVRERFMEGNLTKELEAALLPAAFAETYFDFVLPEMEKGVSIVMDRWTASYAVYQFLGNSEHFKKEDSPNVFSFFSPVFCQEADKYRNLFNDIPDVTFVCDVPVDVANLRLQKRSKDGEALNRLDEETNAYKEEIRHNFKTLCEANLIANGKLIDCNVGFEDLITSLREKIDTLIEDKLALE